MVDSGKESDPPPNSELYIGFIGAVGTNIKKVEEELANVLTKVGYEVEVVRLSDLAWEVVKDFPDAAEFEAKVDETEDKRLSRLMNMGNKLRSKLGLGNAMVLPAIAKIRSLRDGRTGTDEEPKRAFLIHSLKHQAEIATLRAIYREKFVTVSVYSPYAARVENLKKKICQDKHSYDLDVAETEAVALVDRDMAEVGNPLGQNLRECFPLADVFVDQTDEKTTVSQITRFVEILFGHQFHTPTMAEMGMFFARAASLRSSDLSRQVGAVIMGSRGEVLATGCNEVPTAGGDAHWPEDSTQVDNRDFAKGYDQTARVKVEMLAEIFEKLREKGMLNDAGGKTDEELASEALAGAGAMLKGTRAASIIEFGRAVHAEMFAISQAARLGLEIGGQSMFTTTFPCHMCARHIIASGIRQVFYIEPYPKSMTAKLYPDDVIIDADPVVKAHWDATDKRVRFVPFMGIAPNRFIDFFRSDERKDNYGWAKEWKAPKAQLRIKSFPVDTKAELTALKELKSVTTN